MTLDRLQLHPPNAAEETSVGTSWQFLCFSPEFPGFPVITLSHFYEDIAIFNSKEFAIPPSDVCIYWGYIGNPVFRERWLGILSPGLLVEERCAGYGGMLANKMPMFAV